MDEIIKRMKNEKDVIVKYSTVGDYIHGVKADAIMKEIEWPIYTGDLLPQLTDMTEYWTGYYTSIPFFKKTTRQFSDYTNASGFLYALKSLGDTQLSEYREKAEELFIGLTVNFHHDAITGTHTEFMEVGNLKIMKDLYKSNEELLVD